MSFLTKLKKPKVTRMLGGALGLLLVLSLVLVPVPALAIQPPPHQFWGTVTIDTELAPEGTIVSAQIGGVEYVSTTVDAEGRYGYILDVGGTGTFKVPADDPDTPEVKEGGVAGETVEFYIGVIKAYLYDVEAEEWLEGYPFEIWGTTKLNLMVGEVPTQYSLTVDSTDGGSVTTPGEDTFTYDPGAEVPLLAEPDTGFLFLNWTGDTDTIDDVNAEDTTITMTGNYAITANFVAEEVTYSLTIDSTTGGLVTEPGEGVFPGYAPGAVVDLLAVPDTGYQFLNWTGETGAIDDVNAEDTFITMTGDYSITANFVPPEVLMYIALNAGWNTFSTPIALDPDSNTWGGLLALSGLDDVEIVYDYDVSTQYWGLVTTGDAVKPLDGFYVKLSDESLGGTVTIIPNPGATPPPSKDLSTGLNLIGPAPASLVDEDVIFNLATIYEAEGGLPGYSMVISPPIHTPNDWVYMRDDPDPPLMRIGNAYWVTMENPDTLWGSSSTPILE